jgi:hypothetical protein
MHAAKAAIIINDDKRPRQVQSANGLFGPINTTVAGK